MRWLDDRGEFKSDELFGISGDTYFEYVGSALTAVGKLHR